MMQYPLRHRFSTGLLAIVPLALAILLSSSSTASAQPKTRPPAETVPPPQPSEQNWRQTMTRTPLPKSGCFTSSYPSTEWREVPCTTPLPRPYPARGPHPANVGNATDFMVSRANPNVNISLAAGSFDSVTGVINETENGNANTFSLQLNTNNDFSPPACIGAAPGHTCTGWQQFLFSTDGCLNGAACAFMQYWLLDFGAPCPPAGGGATGWIRPPAPFANDCFANSLAVLVPPQTIAALRDFVLTGTAARGGSDIIFIATGNPPTLNAMNSPDGILDLAQGWHQAEFNIFGDCCDTKADFNPGSTLVVRVSVDQAAGAALSLPCPPPALGLSTSGTTGETNNLTLVAPPAVVAAGPLPAMVFTESNIPTKGQTCPVIAPVVGTIPVFRCVQATKNLNGAYGVGMLVTHPEICSHAGPVVNPSTVPAYVATPVTTLPPAAGLPVFVCNQFAQNLAAKYGIGELTTHPQFCWDGGPAGPTVLPSAVSAAVATNTGLMAGNHPIFRCNHTAPHAPYGIGVLTTHPQFCAPNGPISPPGLVSSSIAVPVGWDVR